VHGFFLGSGLLAGASDRGTINVTIKCQQSFAVDENSCSCSSCRTLGLERINLVAVAPGSVLHGATGAAPPGSHSALLKRSSGSRTAPRPTAAKPDLNLPTPRRSISSPSHNPQRRRASGREILCPRTKAISWRRQGERNPPYRIKVRSPVMMLLDPN
jgi:hypothetical protein